MHDDSEGLHDLTQSWSMPSALLSLLLGLLILAFAAIFTRFAANALSVCAFVLLHNVTPVFAVFGGWFFLGQQIDFRYLVGADWPSPDWL